MEIILIFNDTEDGLKQMPNIFLESFKGCENTPSKGQATPTNLSSTSIDTSV